MSSPIICKPPESYNIDYMQEGIKETERTYKETQEDGILTYDVEADTFSGRCLLITFILFVGEQFIKVTSDYIDFITADPLEKYQDIPIHVLHGYDCVRRFRQCIFNSAKYCKKLYVMGFNASRYDHFHIFDNLPRIWVPTSLMYTSATIKRIAWTHAKDKCKIITQDVLMLCPFGNLAAKGKQLKVPKFNEEIDIHKFKYSTRLEYVRYCARDTLLCWLTYTDIFLPSIMPSVGLVMETKWCAIQFISCASLAYHSVIKEIDNLYNLNKPLHEYVIQGYYGAKVDGCVFGKQFDEPITAYDIKSMYPACMYWLPVGKPTYSRTYKKALDLHLYLEGNDFLRVLPFICTVRLTKDKTTNRLDNRFGVLPVRHREYYVRNAQNVDTESLTYLSCGDVTAVYTIVDIMAALKDGWIIKEMRDFVIWPTWTDVFTTFYKKWFAIKQSYKGDAPEYKFAKLILNSSIGMFGLKVMDEEEGCNHKPVQLGIFCLSWTRWLQVKIKETMRLAGIERPLYGDTDSIFMPSEDWTKFLAVDKSILCKDLGDPLIMTGEIDCIADGLLVYATKCYCAYGDKNKYGSRGVSKNSLTKEEYMKLVHEPGYKFDDVRLNFPKNIVLVDGVFRCYICPNINRTVTASKSVPCIKEEDKQGFMINKCLLMFKRLQLVQLSLFL